jgi:hypothetical protein
MTGRKPALAAVGKVLGQSAYQAREGANTGGANGVYWVEIIGERPDGLVMVRNLTEGTKREVESVERAIETGLLHPLLRGRDVGRWQVRPEARIIMVQHPQKRTGYDEAWLKDTYPKTFSYLQEFETSLRARSVFRRYFQDTGTFYSMFNIGEYTFAPWKVVWREVASKLDVAVVGPVVTQVTAKCAIPDHTLIMVACQQGEEAHFLCSILNSSPSRFVVQGYIVLHPDPHILEHVAIPRFEPDNAVHQGLAALSRQAHASTTAGDAPEVKRIEAEIDRLAARLWGLTEAELREIQRGLAELG